MRLNKFISDLEGLKGLFQNLIQIRLERLSSFDGGNSINFGNTYSICSILHLFLVFKYQFYAIGDVLNVQTFLLLNNYLTISIIFDTKFTPSETFYFTGLNPGLIVSVTLRLFSPSRYCRQHSNAIRKTCFNIYDSLPWQPEGSMSLTTLVMFSFAEFRTSVVIESPIHSHNFISRVALLSHITSVPRFINSSPHPVFYRLTEFY